MNALIKIAQKRQRKGTGSLILPLERQSSVLFTSTLSVPYAIIGGQATKSYMPERATLDWHILIHKDDGEKAEEELKFAAAHTFRPLSIEGFSCILSKGTPLDVIFSEEEWIEKALKEAKTACPANTDPVIPLPWLVLLKMQASIVQDLADISRMIARAETHTQEETREIIKTYLPDALEDVDSLIELGKLEL